MVIINIITFYAGCKDSIKMRNSLMRVGTDEGCYPRLVSWRIADTETKRKTNIEITHNMKKTPA